MELKSEKPSGQTTTPEAPRHSYCPAAVALLVFVAVCAFSGVTTDSAAR